MKIYYVFPDAETFSSYNLQDYTEEVCSMLVKNREADVYEDAEMFQRAFNNGSISDEGYIFFF